MIDPLKDLIQSRRSMAMLKQIVCLEHKAINAESYY